MPVGRYRGPFAGKEGGGLPKRGLLACRERQAWETAFSLMGIRVEYPWNCICEFAIFHAFLRGHISRRWEKIPFFSIGFFFSSSIILWMK